MLDKSSHCWWHGREWTLGLCLALVVLNIGVMPGAPAWAGSLVSALQFDRTAILGGEIWRLITGNLVHWSPEHFALDVAVFLVVGLLVEPAIRRAYPWLLLAAAASVGLTILLFQPELDLYRGLSGVDSGQFAAALGIECLMACRQKRRWLWVAPAAAIFLTKAIYESTSGRLFFGTESLGEIGSPVPLAHVAGVVVVLGFAMLFTLRERHEFESRGSQDPQANIALWRW